MAPYREHEATGRSGPKMKASPTRAEEEKSSFSNHVSELAIIIKSNLKINRGDRIRVKPSKVTQKLNYMLYKFILFDQKIRICICRHNSHQIWHFRVCKDKTIHA